MQTPLTTVPDVEDWRRPCAPAFYPHTMRDLNPGDTKLWCTCGLSKKQPWCDGSHKDTPFKPLKWVVPGANSSDTVGVRGNQRQTLYSICACKYTRDPPYCDATHTNLPCQLRKQQENCPQKDSHGLTDDTRRLCAHCGWTPNSLSNQI